MPLAENRFMRYTDRATKVVIMTAITLDKLQFVRILEGVGVDRKHAEAMAEAVSHAKVDAPTHEEFTVYKSELAQDIKELEHRIERMHDKIVLKLGSMMVVAIGTVAVMVKLL